MSEKSFKVETAQAGQRADQLVGEALGLSRAKLKALFEAGAVRANGRKVKKGDPLVEGATITVQLEEAPAGPAVVPQPELPLEVLHTDDALVFVNKQSGMAVHPLEPGERGTVANALVARHPECADAGKDPREAGLCHRIDRETSGVLLAARNRAAWEQMREAFGQADGVDKRYLALVYGPLTDEDDIDIPLAHHGDHVRPAYGDSEGRPALSRFRVTQRQGAYSLVEVRILTGVLHQVRAHLAAIGAPLVGDEKYGGPAAPELGRFFLHAASLTVKHPATGKQLTVTAPLPQELGAFLTRLGFALR